MTTIEKSVDVEVPVTTAYNQWTQFESFPAFMEGVEKINQLSATRTHWVTKIGGVSREFDAEITEQHPDERIAWHTVGDTEENTSHGGVVTFHRLNDTTTRVNLQMEYHPESFVEKAGAALGVVGIRVKGDLDRFKDFIEKQGTETGAWRGDVDAAPQHRTEAAQQQAPRPGAGVQTPRPGDGHVTNRPDDGRGTPPASVPPMM